MVILTEAQADLLRNALTAVIIGEPYQVSTLETCLEYLITDNTMISCPMERQMTRLLANEMINWLRDVDQNQ